MIFSIAIDGPAGAGKSTVARALAERMQAMYLDTGAMYRAIGLHYIRSGQINDTRAIAEGVRDVDIRVKFEDGAQHVYLGDEDVSAAIRSPEGSMAASKVGTVREVRLYMVELQRKIAEGIPVVMDGRDIGTVVLPRATLKVFLTASAAVRALRRYTEMRDRGEQAVYHEILDDIVARDYNDSHRAESPLQRAEDAVLLDTSDMTIEQVISEMERLCRERIGG